MKLAKLCQKAKHLLANDVLNGTVNIGDDEMATDLAHVAVWGPAQASPDTVRPSNLQVWLDASDASTVYATSDCSTTSASADGDALLLCGLLSKILKVLHTISVV